MASTWKAGKYEQVRNAEREESSLIGENERLGRAMSKIGTQISHENQMSQRWHAALKRGRGDGGGESKDNDLHGRVRGHVDKLGER